MPFRRMRYFVAVAERRSFGRAAADLHVAQSALSRHIAELERSVGARLLDRSPRGVQMTPVGAILFEDCRRVLSQVEAAFDHARLIAGGLAGQLTVGYSDLAARTPCALNGITPFMKAHPGVALRLDALRSSDQLEALRSRRIDCGFMIERATALAELDYLTVGSDRFVLAAPEGHPLLAQPHIAITDLDGLPYVAVSRDYFWPAQSKLLARCRANGFQPNIVLEVGSERLQLGLVAMGVGVGLVNESARRELPPGVVLRAVEGLEVGLDIDLVWLRRNEHELLDAFITSVRAAVADISAGNADLSAS